MLALLDYGSGNIRSVEKALVAAGAEVRRVASPADIGPARGLVLPGVGAFDDCLQALQRQELAGAVQDWISAGRPFLGICVGYQASSTAVRSLTRARSVSVFSTVPWSASNRPPPSPI